MLACFSTLRNGDLAIKAPMILCALAIILALVPSCSSRPAPSQGERLVVRDGQARGKGTAEEEIQCYLLPYGGIGILSHALVYWQIFWLGMGRSPLWPPHALSHSRVDLVLNGTSLLVTVPLAILTIVRCKDSWQFVLISVWKTTMTITQSCVALHASLLAARHLGKRSLGVNRLVTRGFEDRNLGLRRLVVRMYGGRSYAAFAWIIIYLGGTVFGLVGLFSVVTEELRGGAQAHNVRVVTGALGGFLGLATVVAVGIACCTTGSAGSGLGVGFTVGVTCLAGIAAFYSDLVLAAVANQWSGVPRGRWRSLYWMYFSAKRLPLFST